MPFLDEQVEYLRSEGVGDPAVVIFATSKTQIPTGDGPYLILRDTGGMNPERTQSGSFQRPSAQLMAVGKNVTTTRGLIKKAYDAYVDRNGLLKVRNRVIGAVSRAVTSITRTGSIATVTCAVPHRFVSGMYITISGADQAPYNGEKQITVPDGSASTFTYEVSGSPVTPATGTIVAAFLGTRYREVDVTQEPFDMGLDKSDRFQIGFNITAVKVPS